MRRRLILSIVVFSAVINQRPTSADVMNLPAGQTSLSFVTVGDAGNMADADGLGAVNYVFEMGKYDVTLDQYAAFLNSVAAADPYGLYNTLMDGYEGSLRYGISQSGTSGHFSYSVFGNGNLPMFTANWGQAAQFANWLQNGQPTGPEGPGTTETGAYTLNGAVTSAALYAITRNADATYFIPSENEWYKAAYYKGGNTNAGYWLYPTRSNSPPSNVISSTGTNNADFNGDGLTPVGTFADSPGPYGTFDQGGFAFQWNESQADIGGFFYRGSLGGDTEANASPLASSANGGVQNPAISNAINQGFRIAAIPEPSTFVLLVVGAFALLVLTTGRRVTAVNTH